METSGRQFKGCFYIICIFISLAVLSIVGITHITSRITSSLAKNQVINEGISPDNKYKAVLFERNTGATDAYSYHLSLIGTNNNVGNEIGNICISKEKFSYKWLDEHNLEIITHGEHLYKKVAKHKGVTIFYTLETRRRGDS